MLTSGQVRAARAFLGWTALDLANASQVGVATIRRAEVVDGVLQLTPPIAMAIRTALENAGIEFIDANGGGEGVRLKKPSG